MWLESGGIKHGHAHTGYMIAAGCCAGPAAAKEETWKAVCLTIPWYQFTTSKGGLSCTIFRFSIAFFCAFSTQLSEIYSRFAVRQTGSPSI